LFKQTNVLKATLWHHKHGRQFRKDAAVKKQYLTLFKEKSLVDYILCAVEYGYSVPVKLL